MTENLETLEKLFALHKSGAISDDEYQHEKNRLLAAGTQRAREPAPKNGKPTIDRADLSQKWQRRFEIFDRAGSPFSRKGRPTYQALSYGDRMIVGFNLWAFVFGVFYFFYLGMPKRAVGLFTASLLLTLTAIGFEASDNIIRLVGITVQSFCAAVANYFYYIRVTNGRDEWNPFKDL